MLPKVLLHIKQIYSFVCLDDFGIEIRIWYYPLHVMVIYRSNYFYDKPKEANACPLLEHKHLGIIYPINGIIYCNHSSPYLRGQRMLIGYPIHFQFGGNFLLKLHGSIDLQKSKEVNKSIFKIQYTISRKEIVQYYLYLLLLLKFRLLRERQKTCIIYEI